MHAPTLQPLASVREHISLITDRQFAPGTGVHAQAGCCWLTSSPPQETLDGGFPTNVTLDQLLELMMKQFAIVPDLDQTKWVRQIGVVVHQHVWKVLDGPRMRL